MDDIVVSKDKLLNILRENRAKHLQLYGDALEGARIEYRKLLVNEISKIDSGETVEGSARLRLSKSHEEEYNETIGMLEMSVEDKITLTRHEFQNYVQDKWINQDEKRMLHALALTSSNSEAYKNV
jgi:hypothetical protein